jgi:hypothetical protein
MGSNLINKDRLQKAEFTVITQDVQQTLEWVAEARGSL